MPRPITDEDPRDLLEEHLMERIEADIRKEIIDLLVCLLDRDPCFSEDREIYRWQLGMARREERRVQKLNHTELVLDSATYDAEAGDEMVDLTEDDLHRLAWERISVPLTRIWHGEIVDTYRDGWRDDCCECDHG